MFKIVNSPCGAVESSKDKFEVFYVDYGNQEVVSYRQLRPLEASVSSSPGLAQLCSLAHVKVPGLEDDYGQEAAYRLSELLLSGPKEFRAVIEEKDTSGGKVKGQGTGRIFLVTLVDPESDVSINATLLKEGLARWRKRRDGSPRTNSRCWMNWRSFRQKHERRDSQCGSMEISSQMMRILLSLLGKLVGNGECCNSVNWWQLPIRMGPFHAKVQQLYEQDNCCQRK